MKIRNAVRCAILGASIAAPALSMAAGMPVFAPGDCVESLNEGGMIQESCSGGQYFRTTITDAGFTSVSVVSATGAGGLALTNDIVDTDFEANTTINTGSFLVGADNTGLHITDAGYVASVSHSQWVDLGPDFVEGGTNPSGHILFLRFEQKSGSADNAGNTEMARFFNQMNSPNASGSRYAPDTRYLDLNNEGTFLDISVPDSLINFRLQRADTTVDGGGVEEYLRFGSRSSEVEPDAQHAFSRITDGTEVFVFGGHPNFQALVDSWQDPGNVFYDFTTDTDVTAITAGGVTPGNPGFWQNTNYPYALTADAPTEDAGNPTNALGSGLYTQIGGNSFNYSGPF